MDAFAWRHRAAGGGRERMPGPWWGFCGVAAAVVLLGGCTSLLQPREAPPPTVRKVCYRSLADVDCYREPLPASSPRTRVDWFDAVPASD